MAKIVKMSGPEVIAAYRDAIDQWVDQPRDERTDVPRPFKGLRYLVFNKDMYDPKGLYAHRVFLLYVDGSDVLGYKSYFTDPSATQHVNRNRAANGLDPIKGRVVGGEAISVSRKRLGIATALTDHLLFQIMRPGDIYKPSSYEPDGVKFTKTYLSRRSGRIHEMEDSHWFTDYAPDQVNYLTRGVRRMARRVARRFLRGSRG